MNPSIIETIQQYRYTVINTSNRKHFFIFYLDIHNFDINIPRKKNVQEGDFMWKTRTSDVSIKSESTPLLSDFISTSYNIIFFIYVFFSFSDQLIFWTAIKTHFQQPRALDAASTIYFIFCF